jgi:hypothetical protein
MSRNLPELVPNATSNRSWTGKSGKYGLSFCSKSNRDCSGMTPRTPPPSIPSTFTPLVFGLNLNWAPWVSWEQRKQELTMNLCGSLPNTTPKRWISIPQKECPQGRPYSGLRQRHIKQVPSLWMSFQLSWKDNIVCRWDCLKSWWLCRSIVRHWFPINFSIERTSALVARDNTSVAFFHEVL